MGGPNKGKSAASPHKKGKKDSSSKRKRERQQEVSATASTAAADSAVDGGGMLSPELMAELGAGEDGGSLIVGTKVCRICCCIRELHALLVEQSPDCCIN